MADETKIDPIQVAEDAISVGQEVAKSPRGFWKSKTFWTVGLLVAAHYFGFINPHATPYLIAGAAAALRLISTGKVSLTGK